MQEKPIWFLENIDISGIFCPKKMTGMPETHSEKTFRKGDYIYMPEENADKIYFIVRGRIKVGAYNQKGKEVTKAILSEGEVFGELTVIGQEKRRDFAMAMETTEVCMIDRHDIKSLLRDRSALGLFLLRIFGSRVLELEKRLESLVFRDSRTRIINFLIDLNEKEGERVGYEWVVRKFITHQEIANITATSRQTVTTVLNELRNEDLITFDRRRLLIRDLDRLKELSGPESS